MRTTTQLLLVSVALAYVAGCSESSARQEPPEPADASVDQEPDCLPESCETAGAECGRAPDGCGGAVECGTCTDGQTCGAAGPNRCGVGACLPATCLSIPAQCGVLSNRCDDVLDCGGCPAFYDCTVDSPSPACTCLPATCLSLGAGCGEVPDGCGNVLSCGECAGGQTCGAAGPNVCGVGSCSPKTCLSVGASCGMVADGCGGVIDCGGCPDGETCGGSGVPNACGCSPRTCGQLGTNCGSVDDTCGNLMACGTCQAPETCGGSGVAGLCGKDTSCTPDWQDTGPCDCTPTGCEGCTGTKPQSDGCGNTRLVDCNADATGCPDGFHCEGPTCMPDCPDGWEGVWNAAQTTAYCVSPYLGTGTCCDVWNLCDNQGRKGGWPSIPGYRPPGMDGLFPGTFVEGTEPEVCVGPGGPSCIHCQVGCYDGSGVRQTGALLDVCNSCGDPCPCSTTSCGGSTCEGCGCAYHVWCHTEVSP